jgi:anaerobic selenocysteine-containing dehydrogenase
MRSAEDAGVLVMKFSLNDLAPILRQFDGPLTSELVRRPGDFGLGQVPAKAAPDATTTMVCGFCSTGCGLKIHLRDGVAVNLSPDTAYPVNLGMACPKGWEALTPLDAPDRGTSPLLDGKPATWHDAMTEFSVRLRDIQKRHGLESVAILSTGQIVTEEMCFLGALARLGLGIQSIDSNTRQCMATSHVAYKQSYGFDAPGFTYADFEQSDVLVFIGANPCIAHPIMWQRVLRNRRQPEILVVDPRKTETAMAATRHFGIAPKSDLTLLYGLANILISNGWIDREFIARSVTGFDEFAEFVREFNTERVAAATGLTSDALVQFATLVGDKTKRVSWWWTMGVNQSHESTRTAQAIIALALITGQIGKPGTGANSITGQCNAMGSRLFAHASGLPCGRDFLKAEDREEVAGIYGMPVEKVPAVNSPAYDQIIEGVKSGRIKALWVLATNSAHSWGSSAELRRALQGLELLVVQDMYPTTETAQLAHIYFPAAGWGEKEGTFINSERRIGLAKKVRRAPGEALSDFNILRLVAEYCGVGEQFREWSSPEAVFRIMQRLSSGRPCDITGIGGYAQLDAQGGVQWPYHASSGALPEGGERRLFSDGRFFHADGKARILFDQPRLPSEPVDSVFPFVLLTGRGTSAQWHTGSRTAKSAILTKMHPARTCVEIHPEDAASLGIATGELVEVKSRRGIAKAHALVTSTVQPRNVFMAMHDAQVNHLTAPDYDPHSRQPSYKYCAVAISRAL